MMILRTSPPSPFGRKVLLAASLLGLSDEITIEKADPSDDNDTLRGQNPVGKIPILILDDGTTLFDSRVILEYLDHRAGGGKIIPREPKARFAALRLQALADGITDASLLVLYEGRFRPSERHEPKWLDYQNDKIARGFAVLEAAPPPIDPIPERRADRARLPARPPRPALQGRLARRPSQAGRLARPLRRAGAGVRRNEGDGVIRRRFRYD